MNDETFDNEEMWPSEDRIDAIGASGNTGDHYKRVCNMCEEEKSLVSDFYRRGSGYQHHCIECAKEHAKAHNYRKTKLAHLKHVENPLPGLIRAAKHRAKKKGIPFSIVAEDLEIPEMCPVLDIPIFSKGRNNPNAPSIDRMIPSRGYIKGNVHIISRRANVLKGDGDLEELQRVVDYVKRNI